MSARSQFIKHLSHRGQAAVLYSITGTACPCWTYRGTGYSKQWHRDNPSADDCNGTGLISSSTASTNIKIFPYPIAAGIGSFNISDEIKQAIGKINDIDLIVYGTLDTDSHVFKSLVSYTDEDYITYDLNNYRIARVIELIAGEIILMKLK